MASLRELPCLPRKIPRRLLPTLQSERRGRSGVNALYRKDDTRSELWLSTDETKCDCENRAWCRALVAKYLGEIQNVSVFKEGQLVRVNLAGMQAGGVLFHAAVTDAIGNIVRQTSTNPSTYLVHLVFSFKGVSEVEVPEERVRAA